MRWVEHQKVKVDWPKEMKKEILRILDGILYISSIYSMFSELTGFDWDEGNLLKNWEKDGVSHLEAEQVFFKGLK